MIALYVYLFVLVLLGVVTLALIIPMILKGLCVAMLYLLSALCVWQIVFIIVVTAGLTILILRYIRSGREE